ncbi:MAG: sensor histidine kinase [Anaerolineae bacterium]
MITVPRLTTSMNQTEMLSRVRLLRFAVPIVLFVLATAFEFWEHWREGETLLTDRVGTLEVLVFGLVSPFAVFLTVSYFSQIMTELEKARNQTAAINRNLEEIVAARTAALQVTNQELAQANLRLRELDALKSEFVSLVSHELRAPLTALNGGLEVALQVADTLPPSARRILEAMASESLRLTQLVQNILDVSRLEAGRLTLNLGPVAVAPILHRAVEVVLNNRRSVLWQMPAQIPPV